MSLSKYSKVKHSVVYTLSKYLTGEGFTVYDESDIVAGTIPVRPFIYLVEWGCELATARLPMILYETHWSRRPLEMGTSDSFYARLILHVLGRSRGERDGLASGITEDVTYIEIVDPDDGDALVENQALDVQRDGDIWTTSYVLVPRRLREERSLSEWIDLASSFWVLKTEV